ncbi:hypothetical protein [Colwellia piezophila]|uniref:hypothetical protein n=1 Tax=Colwellia piezophila TaxID=211668 RepID=UPI00037A185E|nr:hypothetical protein [Colwellia piezophila]
MKDKFCSPLYLNKNKTIYGGAARNKRIARAGGLEQILNKVISSTFEEMNIDSDDLKYENNVIPIIRKQA